PDSRVSAATPGARVVASRTGSVRRPGRSGPARADGRARRPESDNRRQANSTHRFHATRGTGWEPEVNGADADPRAGRPRDRNQIEIASAIDRSRPMLFDVIDTTRRIDRRSIRYGHGSWSLMAKIALKGVDKVYSGGGKGSGGVKAVDNLDLEIADGEFMVLVGPSGCGKSTALRMIAGLEEISAGELLIGDEVVNDRPPKDRDIAMVFQNYALYPHMTVEQNLAFGLKLRKIAKPEIQRRVAEAAAMLGLEPYLKRKPAALSGGQRQRVAMGRAIVREPQAFLMDEPLSNLDAKLRVQMRASLNQLHERLGVTTVYVTHDQVEAMTLGDRVAVLRDGRLQQVDTPKNLFRNPVNLFVAGFIGSPAMNFVGAELQRDGDAG